MSPKCQEKFHGPINHMTELKFRFWPNRYPTVVIYLGVRLSICHIFHNGWSLIGCCRCRFKRLLPLWKWSVVFSSRWLRKFLSAWQSKNIKKCKQNNVGLLEISFSIYGSGVIISEINRSFKFISSYTVYCKRNVDQ